MILHSTLIWSDVFDDSWNHLRLLAKILPQNTGVPPPSGAVMTNESVAQRPLSAGCAMSKVWNGIYDFSKEVSN